MKYLFAFLLLISSVAFADKQHSIVSGGWSKHFNDKFDYYNENHQITGYEFGTNSKYVGIYKFTNSYYKKSYLLALHENKCNQKYHFTYCYGLFGGYVSGYEKTSIVLAPEVTLKYRLSQHFSLGGSVSCLPGLCAGMVRLTIRN